MPEYLQSKCNLQHIASKNKKWYLAETLKQELVSNNYNYRCKSQMLVYNDSWNKISCLQIFIYVYQCMGHFHLSFWIDLSLFLSSFFIFQAIDIIQITCSTYVGRFFFLTFYTGIYKYSRSIFGLCTIRCPEMTA